MVHIVASISFIKNFRQGLESGQSVARSLEAGLSKESNPFTAKLHHWYACHRAGQNVPHRMKTDYQVLLLEILVQGLEGCPVHEAIEALERDMEVEFERQWKFYLESLPAKLSLPLLFFFFPAYLILMFGPLLSKFLMEVN